MAGMDGKAHSKRMVAGLACWCLLLAIVVTLADAGRNDLAAQAAQAGAHESKPTLEVAPAAKLRPRAQEVLPSGAGSLPGTGTAPAKGEDNFPGLGPLPAGVPPEEEGVGVSLLRVDGSAVIGAVVRWATEEDLQPLLAADPQLWERDNDEILARVTHQVRTAANGWAMVPSKAGRMVIDARFGDLYTSRRFRREETSYLKLTMYRDLPLVVEVADATGAGLDVPVVVRTADGRGNQVLRPSNGRALLLHAPEAFSALLGRPDLYVQLDAPQQALATVLPRGKVPEAAVKVTGQRGVTLQVRVEGPDGPCASGVVEVVRLGSEPELLRTTRRELRDGVALFEHVQPDLELLVRARTACGADVPEQRVQMPADIVQLRHAVRMPRVQGSVQDVDGRKLGGYRATLYQRLPAGWELAASGSIQADGSWELAVPGLATAEAGTAAEYMLVARNEFGATKAALLQGLSSFLDKAAMRAEVGLLRLDNWTIQLGGVVLDENGRGVEGAELELVFEGVPDARCRARSAADGRFDLRAPRLSGPVRVHVSHPGLAVPLLVDAKAGEKQAKVQVAFRGRLRGQVLVPPGVVPQQLQVTLHDAEGSAFGGTADAQGIYLFERVEPGLARISVQVVGLPNSVVSSDSVRVEAGGTAEVQALDLRGVLRAIVVEIVDEDGQPVEYGTVGPDVGGAEAASRQRLRPFEFRDGSARLVVPSAPIMLVVDADGYISQSIATTAEASVRVILKRSAQ